MKPLLPAIEIDMGDNPGFYIVPEYSEPEPPIECGFEDMNGDYHLYRENEEIDF